MLLELFFDQLNLDYMTHDFRQLEDVKINIISKE